MNGTQEIVPEVELEVEERVEPQAEAPAMPLSMPAERIPVVRAVNDFLVFLFRLGLGPGLSRFASTLVLHHTGRHSGRLYRTPVNFIRFAGNLYCVAAYGPETDWFQNIKHHPEVKLWMGSQFWRGRAEIVTDVDEARFPWRRLMSSPTLLKDIFAGEAVTAPDDVIRAGLEALPLVRIHLDEALQEPGGPGDLAWAWAVFAVFVPVMLLGIALVLRYLTRGIVGGDLHEMDVAG